MLKSLLVALVCFASCSFACSCGTSQRWARLNGADPVCFEGIGDKPAILKSFQCNEGFVSAVKLVHRSGNIVCGPDPGSHESNWGCYDWSSLLDTPLNILITDKNKNIIFPKQGVTFSTGVHKNGKWYSVEGFNSRSKTLVLQHSFTAPYYLGPQSELQIWYGEDLLNYYDTDNVGRVCVDVYGYFA